MATATESAPRPAVRNDQDGMTARTVPIISTANQPPPTIKTSAPSPAGDPMEVSTPTANTKPSSSSSSSAAAPAMASRKSPDKEPSASSDRLSAPAGGGEQSSGAPASSANPSTMPAPAPAAAAAAVHQPKIVQTAFIHKLYNMLEDPNIQHLISWSASAESFVMSPSHDFSKVLAQYFKHTNISSFVRQLNMYGFHKVSDVFHTGSPDSALWEFKHGNGNFRRGDLVGLREIKRRASRHALVHREYNSQKPTPPQPGTPAEPMPPIHDTGGDPRMSGMEHSVYDLSSRLQRSEENAHYMHVKQLAMVDTMSRMLQLTHELSRTVLAIVPPENPIHRDVAALSGELHRQSEQFRADEAHEAPFSGRSQYFSNIENPPVSPRQMAQDDHRRMGAAQARGNNFHRPPVPSNLSGASRRPYGSIGAASGTPSSPSPLRPPQAAPPPPGAPPPGPQNLAPVEAPPGSLARRHTSADIRAPGWQGNPPYVSSGPPSTHWPSSPSRAPPEDQRLRESLSTYSLTGAQSHHPQSMSRPTTPPPFSNGITSLDSFNNWNWNSANRENKNLSVRDGSAPPTRRGSMAHILNPTDTAEREDEDDPRADEEHRKRKRLQ